MYLSLTRDATMTAPPDILQSGIPPLISRIHKYLLAIYKKLFTKMKTM